MYTAPHQEHQIPQRQPSFIGLPPISPGPEFGSALGFSSAHFGLFGSSQEDTTTTTTTAPRDRNLDLQGLDRRTAASSSSFSSPPAAPEPAPVAPVPRSLPSPQSWTNEAVAYNSNKNVAETTSSDHNKAGLTNAIHTRADSSSGALTGPSSPSMNNYSTQPVSTYRPSQGQSVHMQGAYAVNTQPLQSQQQHYAHQPVGQSHQIGGGQYTVTVNGNTFQQQQHPYLQQQQNQHLQHQQQQQEHYQPQQQAQQQHHFNRPNPHNGGQYNVNGDGNGMSQQQDQPQQHQLQNQQQQYAQPGSQFAVQNGQPNFAGNQQGGGAPASHQQFAASSGTPRAMPSPSLAQNGTFILPPGWKAEESHLQQPLTSPRHRGSPSISSVKPQPSREAYEIDKETGAMSTRSVSPPTQSTGNMRQLLQEASASSSQNGYAPPNPPFAQHGQATPGSSGGQSSSPNGFAPPNPPFAQQDHGAPLGRTSTNNTQGSDRPDSKRSSRVFNSIRNRLGGNMNDDVTGDGVSDASALSEEQVKKGPSNLFGLRGHGQQASEGRASYDLVGNPERSFFEAPSEKKRSFFTRPTGGMGFGSSGQDQPSRPGTSESYGGMSSPPPIVGFGPSVPRKNRFSKITGMLNRDAKPENQLSQPQSYNGQAHMSRPSLTGQRPFPGMPMSPPGGPVGVAQVNTPHRSRAASAATETRPSFGEHGRNMSVQGFMSTQPPGHFSEEDRGRKVSAGNLLSKFIGKRSESKTREQQLQASNSGLGQPQGMMNQGQSPPRPGQPGQFPSFLAHSMGMPGQPPVLPPQGQYAGLAQQVHQNQHQQQLQGQPQSPPPGLSSARLGAYLQGGPSPGVSPVTQSSGSPFTAQPPGPLNVDTRQPNPLQITQAPSQQGTQNPQSPVAVVQIATAVPIRQVERSPNSNSVTGGFSGQNSPQDSVRGRSSSVVNQIEVPGPRRPLLDSQGRIRSGSSAISQPNATQSPHPVHIAALQQAPAVRRPVHPSSPQDTSHLGPQDSSSIDDERQQSIGHSSQDSPTARRVSQNTANHSQSASQTTPSTSPAPSQEQQPGPPHAPPKSIDAGLAQQYQPDQSQPSAPSPSVYRPSGPQPVHAIQQPVQPPPVQWGAPNRGQNDFQNPASQQSAPPVQQYSMQGRPPHDMMMMTAAPQEQNPDKEGAFARMLKTSKTFVQERTSSEKSKSEREKLGAKLLGAFKKAKQAEATPPTTPPVASGPPGGPAWGSLQTQVPQPLQRPSPPLQTQSAPLPTPQVVTEGLQQMPSKAQQLLGQPPNAMYQAPADQPPPKARRSSSETAKSQPYLNYQEERQAPGKTTPPLSPDHIGTPPATTATVPSASQSSQPNPGRPSTSSAPSVQGSQGPVPPQQKPQQQPTQPRPSFDKPMSSNSAAPSRGKNPKQQFVAPDQQYAPVAIPQAYATVYAGQATPALAVNAPVYAQPPLPYQAQQQQWMHPSMMHGMVPGQMPPHMAQQGLYQQYPPYQGTPPPIMNAAYQAPPQQYMQAQPGTPAPPNQGRLPSPGVSGQQPVHQPSSGEYSEQPREPSTQQQGWQQPMTASPPVQEQRAQSVDQQASITQQQISLAPSQQPTPVPPQSAHSPPPATLPGVSGPQQHYTVTPDVVTASPVQVNDAKFQVQQPSPVKAQSSSPSNENVPRSTFAVQAMPEQSQLQPPQSSSGDLMPQRQTSGASQVSSLTTEPATHKGSPDIQRAQIAQTAQTPGSIPSTQPASPERRLAPITLKDEPWPREESVNTSAPLDKDDLYGATPRQSAMVAQEQYPIEHIILSEPAQQSPIDESESKFAGMPAGMSVEPSSEPKIASPAEQHFFVDASPAINEPKSATPPSAATTTSTLPNADTLTRSKSSDEEPPSPTESELKPEEAKREEDEASASANAGENGKTNNFTINGKPVQSSQEIFDEHKRKQLVRDMEEKIAIMPEPPMLEPPKKMEDVPMMSATSYPGQEWNPYGDGFEEDDE